MKNILKMVLSLLIGALIGIAAVGVLVLLLEGPEGMMDVVRKASELPLVDFVVPILHSFAAMLVAFVLHLILHEGGHLLMGLATGYRFSSFRIASIAFVRKDGQIRVRRYKLAGTGGQCLMLPPEMPVEQVPFFWYNAGGVIMNVVFALFPLILLLKCNLTVWWSSWCIMMLIVGLSLAVLNGIPMRLGGMQNDGMNILILFRTPEKRKDFVRQLQIAVTATEGKRVSEMPAEWFDCDSVDDYRELLRLASRLNHQARLIDEGRFLEAHASVEDLLKHFNELPQIVQLELAGEYIFTECLTEGRKEVIEKYWTKNQSNYVKTSARFSSSKQRILFAYALYAEKDIDTAQKIY
ncbi:MAG: M50 family metallopeptidase, partial [Bacteroidaceae bacterium]|nr:M50 family metallopeptidase [Bacteroidaceae bacterium]